ncbi:S24/S26 family peptidase [Halosimplex sp. J119]
MSPPRDGEGPPDDDDGDGASPNNFSGGDPTSTDSGSADGPLGPDDSAGPDGDTRRSDEFGSRDSAAPNGGAETIDPPGAREEQDHEDDGALRTFVVDVLSSAIAVLLVGVLLFAVSGVWPPMVAVESPSMTPHMKTGDLVFVMEEHRFPGDGAVAGTGVVTADTGEQTDYRKFAKNGDVIIYKPDGSETATPIIHRAMFWVNESENWYDEADRQSVGRYSECGETPDEAMPNCPAPHAGFVTKGDANGLYDQVQPLSGPVKPAWVVGTAEVRIPKLGCIRLRSEGCMNGALGFAVPDASATPFEQSCLCNQTAG